MTGDDRYDQPALNSSGGPGGWSDQLNDNFQELGIEIIKHVATWADLPTREGTTSDNGQETAYLVLDPDGDGSDQPVIVVEDTTNDEWDVVAGLGSANHPLVQLIAADATVQNAPTDATDVARKQETDALATEISAVDTDLQGHKSGTEVHGATGDVQGATDVSNSISTHASDANIHHDEQHASEHHEGGAQELDAQNLGSTGADDGHVLTAQGDGTNAYQAPGGTIVASETDDGSDITHYTVDQGGSQDFAQNLVDITGSGICLGGWAEIGQTNLEMSITVDGGTTYTVAGMEQAYGNYGAMIPPISFDSSLTIHIDRDVDNITGSVRGWTWVKQ